MPSPPASRHRFRSTSSSKRVRSRCTSKTSCSTARRRKNTDVRVVYADPSGRLGTLDEARLDATTDRHRVALPPPELGAGEPLARLVQDSQLGLVVALAGGSPNRAELGLLARGLSMGRRVWLHWPEEGVVEVATRERLESYRRHWLVINLYQSVAERILDVIRLPMRVSLAMRDMPSREMPKWVLKRAMRVLSLPRQPLETSGPTPLPSSDPIPTTMPPPMIRHAHRLSALRRARLAAKTDSLSAAAESPRSATPHPRMRRVFAHRLLGAHRVRGKLRTHVLRGEGAGW